MCGVKDWADVEATYLGVWMVESGKEGGKIAKSGSFKVDLLDALRFCFCSWIL